MKRLLVLLVLLVTPLSPAGEAHATVGAGVSTAVTSHGLQVTLVLPQRSYPRNGLVKTTVSVRNVTAHAVLTRLEPLCGSETNPSIEVSDPQGRLMPQLPSITYDNPGCKRATGKPLLPGQTYRQHLVAVLSGPYVRAVVRWGKWLHRDIATRRIRVRLTSETPLVGTLHSSPIGPYATVQRPSGAKGSLYVAGSTQCGSPTDPGQTILNLVWSPVSTNRAYSGCSGAQDWHALAGYLNYPVVTIDYTSP
jgi:hypothetical protein